VWTRLLWERVPTRKVRWEGTSRRSGPAFTPGLSCSMHKSPKCQGRGSFAFPFKLHFPPLKKKSLKQLLTDAMPPPMHARPEEGSSAPVYPWTDSYPRAGPCGTLTSSGIEAGCSHLQCWWYLPAGNQQYRLSLQSASILPSIAELQQCLQAIIVTGGKDIDRALREIIIGVVRFWHKV